jgi:hypothetical protein
MAAVEYGKGFFQKDVIAPGDDQQPFIRRQNVVVLGIIDRAGLDPLLHQVSGKNPFSGDLGSGQPLFRNQGIDHFLIDPKEFGNLLGG